MRTSTIRFLIAVSLIFLFLSAETHGGMFGPSNYDECILESMKGVTSDVAVKAIMRSCREKFPIKKKSVDKTRNLTFEELSKITGRGSPYEEYFMGDIYNGNDSVTITQLSILVTTKVSKNETTRKYTTYVNIPPRSTHGFAFQILTDGENATYSWSIDGATGYELK